MKNINNSYFNIFKNMLYSDLKLFKQSLVDKIIDITIYVAVCAGITIYILPAFGLPVTYNLIMISGIIASIGIMELFPNAITLASDLTGEQTISYFLTLPIPSWLVVLKIMFYYGITSLTVGLVSIPVGKLLMGSQFNLASVDWLSFSILFILGNFFFGVFAVLLATTFKNMGAVDHVWIRVVFPLWFFGGFQFTWYPLHKLYPWLAYADLLNPFIYVTEGIRASMLGQEGYLPIWLCILMTLIFTITFGYAAIYRLKKQLDFV